MSVLEIENELERMTNSERLFVIEIAVKLIRNEKLLNKKSNLRKSAEIMLKEYENDKELTALTVLDSEDFLDV